MIVPVSQEFRQNAQIQDQSLFQKAFKNPLEFWEDQAQKLHWTTKWTSVLQWNRPYAKWFIGGQLNACENCLDIHMNTPKQNQAAIVWEGENGDQKTLTYRDLYRDVNQLAWTLRNQFNVQKGDRVTIYMPLIPELVTTVLACARIGAIHSVVFGGFSAESLKDRIIDSQSKVVVTADGGFRRGNILNIKQIVDDALTGEANDLVEHVLVFHRLGNILPEPACKSSRDVHMNHLLASLPQKQIGSEPMDSEDLLFILYTSGTTGKPKGIIHSTGGYMTHAKYSTQLVFDLKDTDVYWCTADVGWITGHTYVVYGPLSCGATVVLYE
jgi:acetyl-CoA synthetase